MSASKDYSIAWISEKPSDLVFDYDYSSYDFTTGLFSVPTINKAGNAYMVAHKRNDIASSSILCMDQNGKIKWRKDFKADELYVENRPVRVDQSGNLYYLTKQQMGKKRQITAHSITPDGKEKWSFVVAKIQGRAVLALRGDGSTIVATYDNATNYVYVLNAAGKVTYTKSLPQNDSYNSMDFLTTGNGKILYYKTVHDNKTHKYLYDEIYVYGSDNNLLYTVRTQMGYGTFFPTAARFLDNGDLLVTQNYNRQYNKPAVLQLFDAKGKLKWKKPIYSYMKGEDVFAAGDAVYYRSGYLLDNIPFVLHRLNAATGAETASLRLRGQAHPTVYVGFKQEMVLDNQSIIQTVSNDLYHAKDYSIYEIEAGDLRKIDPVTLKVTVDYTDYLSQFKKDTEVQSYKVVSAHNGFAYVYFSDMQTKKYNLAKIILP